MMGVRRRVLKDLGYASTKDLTPEPGPRHREEKSEEALVRLRHPRLQTTFKLE